jgi:hypothetical protein
MAYGHGHGAEGRDIRASERFLVLGPLGSAQLSDNLGDGLGWILVLADDGVYEVLHVPDVYTVIAGGP